MLSVIIPAYNKEVMIEKATAVIGQLLTDAGITCKLLLSMMAPKTAHGKSLPLPLQQILWFEVFTSPETSKKKHL